MEDGDEREGATSGSLGGGGEGALQFGEVDVGQVVAQGGGDTRVLDAVVRYKRSVVGRDLRGQTRTGEVHRGQ